MEDIPNFFLFPDVHTGDVDTVWKVNTGSRFATGKHVQGKPMKGSQSSLNSREIQPISRVVNYLKFRTGLLKGASKLLE